MALGKVNSTSTDEAVLGHGALSREALIAANVNPDTGLATDYLNHFNEVIMLMEMLPDMPDCVEDVLAWEPLDYCSHFEMSALKDKDIAVLAYQSAPQAVKAHLETLVMQIDQEVKTAQDLLRGNGTCDATLHRIVQLATDHIKPLIAAAGGTIHGEVDGEDAYVDESIQAEVDSFF